MRRARVALWLALGLAAATPAFAQARRAADGFPHQQHERLFPSCESCHAGVAAGDAATSFPEASACESCHNGTDEQRVSWQRRARAAGMVRFSHPSHFQETDSAGQACATCHAGPGGRRMDVREAAPESCLGCHTHRASAHLAEDNRCATCHVPITEARALSRERVARLPQPPSHEKANFATAHDPGAAPAAATCAVCHARESCARCHVNASQLPLIAGLARDARVAAAVSAKPASYPRPWSHRSDAFAWRHGNDARANLASCATCHARSSCTTCHTGEGAAGILGRMPEPEPGGAGGVPLRNQAPRSPRGVVLAVNAATPGTGLTSIAAPDSGRAGPRPRVVRVHDPGYRTAHGPQAATGVLTCSGCHAQKFCSDCHAGEGRRAFHPANFAVRHATDAYGREADCASCHNTETFCRSCHQQAGLAARGRLDVAFHTAQPLWLLQHGRAARQGLQNCASCHAQRDCLTCHSTTGWGVSPHGPNFDARRTSKRSSAQCLFCHLEVPRGR